MSELQESPEYDAALGAVLGALVGDAAGGVLEFQSDFSPENVDRALTMPGGGVWNLGPGQITDDGELTLCLARELAESPVFDPNRIAQRYVRWLESPPFDIGMTTRAAIGAGQNGPVHETAQRMTARAAEVGVQSKANGSLMRATPLGVWGRHLPEAELVAVAQADSSLTHGNPACRDCVAAYSLAIAHLVLHPRDHSGAFRRAADWVHAHACEEVRAWMSLVQRGELIPCTPHDGFVMIAFVHGFHHLQAGTPYVAALRAVLLQGGDADTNACIVGGLLGACWGSSSIPSTLTTPVLSSFPSPTRPRPRFLTPHDLPDLISRLLAAQS